MVAMAYCHGGRITLGDETLIVRCPGVAPAIVKALGSVAVSEPLEAVTE
jgi:hypothetical protein